MGFKVKGVVIEYLEKPNVKNGRLIQGLLGVGQVGLMAGKQIIDSTKARKIAHIYSNSFLYPGVVLPGVVYDDKNLVDLHRNEIYFDEEKEIFIITGIYQGTSPESYFEVAEATTEFCREVGVKEIYTLGGYGVGKKIEEPAVYGVVYSEERKKELDENNIELLKATDGTLGATGLAGILIPLGEKNGFKSVCLLAETPGSYPDPKASKTILSVLSKLIDIEISSEELDEQIKTMEKELAKMEEYDRKMSEMYKTPSKEETLHYIG